MIDEGLTASTKTTRDLELAWHQEKPRFMARLRKAGRTLEEAEDMAQDVFAEALERLPLLSGIIRLPAWINSLLGKRIIDAWRHDQVRRKVGESDVSAGTLGEIIAGVGLDPLDTYVQETMVDALNDALRALPAPQREVIEAQVFGGLTFREIAEQTGTSIDTLMARKRYGIKNLTLALKHWIDD